MSESPLIYPTLSLLLYDLYEGLGQPQSALESNRLRFWCRVDEELQEAYKSLEKLTRSAQIIETFPQNLSALADTTKSSHEINQLKKDYRQLKDHIHFRLEQLRKKENPNEELVVLGEKLFPDPLDGYDFPVHLRDTYGLLVNLSVDEVFDPQTGTYQPDYSPQPYAKLAYLHQKILAETAPGTIGQTWLFWAQLSAPELNQEEVIKTCCEQFHLSRKPTRLGEWEGAEVYEVLQLPQDWAQQWEKLHQSYQHFLMLLFPAEASLEEIRKTMSSSYLDLIKLFCAHNKMVWSYGQHRRQVYALNQQYGELNQLINKVKGYAQLPKVRGKQRQEMKKDLIHSLQLSSEYAVGLKNIQGQRHTMKVNYRNYQMMVRNFPVIQSSGMMTLAGETYQPQMEVDYESLSPLLPVTENVMRTLEAVINLQQTESDRQLNTTIQVFGTGLTTASITAAILSTQVQKPTYELPWWSALSLSLVVGFCLGFVIYLITRRNSQ